MSAFVVDTNVVAVSNDFPDGSQECILACQNALQSAMQEMVVIDSMFRIVREYKRYASQSGQPGIGDSFLLWLLRNLFNQEYCELVSLTEQSENEFAEFPADPDLTGFDPSDRKFVAVALASKHSPVILNATDTDWWDFREALARNHVAIQFICPESMAAS